MSRAVTLSDLVDLRAAERPDKTAFVFEDEEISYALLERRSRQVAAGLLAAGALAGDRIAYIGANSAAYYEILFGIARIGAVLMPVNWRLADAELVYILKNGNARMLFAEPSYADRLELADVSLQLRVKLGGLGIEDEYADWRDAQEPTTKRCEVDPDQIVMQLYTSGTTGKPKGAMLSHHGILALRTDVPENDQPSWNRWSADEISILPLPLFHVGTAAWGLIGVYYGATSIIQSEFEPGAFIDAIERYGVTRLCLVPSTLKLIIEHERAQTADFTSVAYTFYGASPIPLALLRDAMGTLRCGFVQIYGMTETSGAVLGLPPEDHEPNGNRRMLSAGKPYPGVELAILDDAGTELREGDIGEVAIRCGATMIGYFDDPEGTAKAVDRNGWLHTGDAGFVDEGYLFIHDRIKEMIISGGENVYPAEVEAVLYEHPAIADVAVIGIPDAKWGEAVKAVVVLRPQAIIGEKEILSWARDRIAGFKLPKSIDFAATLPRNASGKLLRKDLREPYWAGIERRVN